MRPWFFLMVACSRHVNVSETPAIDAAADARDVTFDAADDVFDGAELLEASPPDAAPVGGGVLFTGVTGHAIHTHGGDPAHVTSARFDFVNRDDTPHHVTIASVDFLSDHGVGDCQGPASTFRKHLKPAGLRLADDGRYEPQAEIVISPSSHGQTEVYFEQADAYYAHCDTFAIRVHFQIDGTPTTAVANLRVTRVDPIRRP